MSETKVVHGAFARVVPSMKDGVPSHTYGSVKFGTFLPIDGDSVGGLEPEDVGFLENWADIVDNDLGFKSANGKQFRRIAAAIDRILKAGGEHE